MRHASLPLHNTWQCSERFMTRIRGLIEVRRGCPVSWRQDAPAARSHARAPGLRGRVRINRLLSFVVM
jgi:hypothetical protein